MVKRDLDKLKRGISKLKEANKLFIKKARSCDISLYLRKEDAKLTRICDCCKRHKGHSIFYHWKGILTKAYLGLICSQCAYREGFGSNYKRNKHYIKWKEKNNA